MNPPRPSDRGPPPRAPDASPATFIDRTNQRRLPHHWSGDVCIWDIDKTYLDTSFSSLRGLLGIPLEFAVDKRALPGTVPLLRALRHGPGVESALTPLYFVSGSPRELRRVVERKMTIDGVQFDGIAFKDQWGLLRAGRPRGLVEQVGYKLKALLLYRREHPPRVQYLMFGDDVESDLEIFLLFGEVCAGLRGHSLRTRLAALHVHPRDIDENVTLADAIPVEPDPVAHVFIRQVRGTKSTTPGARVHVASSFVEHARLLRELGKIKSEDVEAVAEDVDRAASPRGGRP